ncbi:MAG: hypothetical protein UY26_C0003G0252 [Candidatus Jorgensenbacteria bacterium GW2011_GWA1_48_13]|uniref:Uncharacterized protein n=1 Tax=Candidatus Jorgensenbacteria bacterium GW2011_GWB1_50_10 TaxID=1618665 RepID=A0A0G1YIP0_9BACT|nr:MAG: hypothetical protein UY26_C0003G0252 [Candidatus Jorgensenbacteria bacterium GW2011_GWA1_48_13]KKW14862.1 MAG: hypothetical protein UY55_C0003G0079 [Candidatus Jorgensenbacteria bacterium GW2011_GWB1_50_10]
MFYFILIAVCAALLIWGGWFLRKRLKLRHHLDVLGMKLYLVRLPKSGKEGKDLKQEINLSEQLFTALASFGKPFVFEIAVPYVGEEIHFFVGVHRSFSEALVRQIQAIWPDADVRPTDDYNIFNYSGRTLGASVVLSERFVLPVRTYVEVGADTFLPFLGAFSKISELGEGGAIQFVIRRAERSRYKKEINSALKFLKKGGSLSEILSHPLSLSLEDVGKVLHGEEKLKKGNYILDEASIKTLEIKLAKQLFEVNVRIFASGPSNFKAEEIFGGLAAGFSQFGALQRNSFKVVQPKNIKGLVHEFSFREFNSNEAMVLTSEELASIFHFPTAFTETPKIKELKAREATPPANLPKNGVMLGLASFRGGSEEVKITDDDRRRHLYLIGQTGTGKSNLLLNMVSDDLRNGKGLAVLDPHGDLVEEILGLMPSGRMKDVVVFDPGDIERPLGLNMIEYNFSRPEEKTFIVNEMQNIFNKLFTAETMGPMFEQYMRNALLLLMEDMQSDPATLMEISRVFTDSLFRKTKLTRTKNPAVYDFWEKEAVKAGGEAALANMTPYITSKFNNFTANDFMRPIIGQVKSAFNFRELMDDGKILLVNLSKGRIGDINANLLGMIITGKILMAALSRVDVPEDKRKDFYLYIDEFQNFTTDSIAVILSEARKYRLNLVIAHQFIGQLTEKIRDAVFGNVGSLVAFRVGAQDAEFLTKQFAPVFSEQDLLNIDNFNAYVKLLINGETSKPFNIKTVPAPKGERNLAERIKENSRNFYGRGRAEVEEEIYKRLRT